MANSSFGRLNIDRSKLKDYIKEFCDQEFAAFTIEDIKLVSDKANQHRCKFAADGKNYTVDFYFNGDGTTTIQPIVGKETHSQIMLATYIVSRIDPKVARASVDYSVRLEKGAVDILVEYLLQLSGVRKLEEVVSPDESYILYKFIGPTGDKLVFKYYKNGTFQIQGKPLYLYHEVSCFLSEYLPFDQVVDTQQQAYCIKLDSAEIKQEIIDLLPKAHTILDPTLQNILVASLAFKKIDINLPDYSSFVSPTLRVLDGYIKRLLHDNGRIISSTFNCFTMDQSTGQYVLQNNIVSCNNTVRAIEEAYNFYSAERHGLMHAGGIPDDHVVIEDPNIAAQKIMEILAVIERTYAYIVP